MNNILIMVMAVITGCAFYIGFVIGGYDRRIKNETTTMDDRWWEHEQRGCNGMVSDGRFDKRA